MYQRILFKSQGYLTYHHFGAQPSFGDLSCWANFGTYMSFVGGIKFVTCWSLSRGVGVTFHLFKHWSLVTRTDTTYQQSKKWDLFLCKAEWKFARVIVEEGFILIYYCLFILICCCIIICRGALGDNSFPFWCFLLVSLLYFHTQQVTILIVLDHACSEDRSHSLTYKVIIRKNLYNLVLYLRNWSEKFYKFWISTDISSLSHLGVHPFS